jgi:uncharacterized membrane protein
VANFKLSVLLQAVDKITAPVKKIGSHVDRLRGPFNRLKARVSAFGSRLSSVMGRLGLSITGLYGTVSAMVIKFATMGDRLAKTADKLGLPIAQLQKYRFAADRSGISTSTFDMAFQRLTRRIGDARKGMGPAYKALADLEVHLEKTDGSAKSNIEVFEEIADKIGAIEDPTERVRLAFAFFDSEGVSMVNMLKDGAAGVRELGQELEDMGGIIEDDAARKSETLIDMVTNVKAVLGGLIASVVGELQPTIIGTLQGFVNTFKENKDRIIGYISSLMGAILSMGKGFFKTIGDIIAILWGWLEPLVAVDEATGNVTEKAEKFGKIGSWLAKILAGIVAIKLAAFIYGLIAPLIGVTTATWSFTAALLANPITWVVLLIVGLIAAIVALIKNWEKVVDAAKWVWDQIAKSFSAVIDWFGGLAKTVWNIGKDFVMWIWEGVKATWNKMVSWIKDAWNAITGFLGFGGGGGAGGPEISGGVSRPGAAAAGFQGHMVVEFKNAPPGTRLGPMETAGDADMSVDTGLSLAGA